MTRFSRRNAGILKIKISRPCLWFKENLGGIWQHLSTYWTIDPQGAADLRPSWGWRPHQCNRDGCFTKSFRTKVQMFIMFTYRGHYCKNFIEKIAFWKKRFLLGISKSKFPRYARDWRACIWLYETNSRTEKQDFMHAYPFLRVVSVFANHCVQIPNFFERVSRNMLLSIKKKN